MLRIHKELSLAIQNNNLAAIRELLADNASFAGMLRWTIKNQYPVLFAKKLF